MKISVYAICHNEEKLLPFFLDHYKQFAEVHVFDNESDDRSVEILKAAKVKVRSWKSNNQIRDDLMAEMKNNFWKSAKNRSDWVMVVDIDEIVYHPDFLKLLNDTPATILQPWGYCMVADKWPDYGKSIVSQVRLGIPDDSFNKMCIFRPDKIKEIYYHPGAHDANPLGDVVVSRDPELKLLHYNYMTLDHHISKYKLKAARMSQENITNKWGIEYLDSESQRIETWKTTREKATDVVGFTI
jgi:glycosyltransferase involved in cell wall biosynthesis